MKWSDIYTCLSQSLHVSFPRKAMISMRWLSAVKADSEEDDSWRMFADNASWNLAATPFLQGDLGFFYHDPQQNDLMQLFGWN